MQRYLIIANPVSGRGTGARMIPLIERLMTQHQLNYTLVQTERPLHAVELAKRAAFQDYDCVVPAGGDGTLNEVLNGLIRAQAEGQKLPKLGLLTVGRGNDFGYSMGVPHPLEAAVQTLAEGKVRRIDIGKFTGGLFPEGRYFGNGVGIGFDAEVGFESLRLAPLSGFASYLVAALKMIALNFHAPKVQIELDDETIVQSSLMISIMNGRRMGGGFYMTPDSKPDDGRFDLCIAGDVSRREVFGLILRFMRGTQQGHPAIKFRRSQHVTITALEGALPAHADGETISLDGGQLALETLPAVLDLLAAAKETDK